MPQPQVLKLDSNTVVPQTYFLPTEKLIVGNPKQTLWMHYTDPTSQFFTGVWSSGPGKWKIAYTEEEFCLMLRGTSIITDTQGVSTAVTAGESFVMPKGFIGTWEVVEETTKRFVIYEAST